MRTIKRRVYTKFKAWERDLLAVWRAEGKSNKECARKLDRSSSTIGRELKRNSFLGKHYVAIHAQAKAVSREYKKAHAKYPLKNPDVFKYVTDHLRCGWSPDQIAGRLKKKHPGNKHWWICAETIYAWIYQPKQMNGPVKWYEYLRRKQKKRKVKSGRKVHKSHIPDRVSIHSRPETVNERSEFGHWEGDTIVGKGKKDGIHTEVERVTRVIMAKKVTKIESPETIRMQGQLFSALPKCARKSTTLDNGRENHMHYQLRKLDMDTWFADPYSAWQRGTNENGNWHIRYYLPKGTDFASLSDEELQDIVDEINARPRKIHGYLTAKEVFDQLVAQEGVAIKT